MLCACAPNLAPGTSRIKKEPFVLTEAAQFKPFIPAETLKACGQRRRIVVWSESEGLSSSDFREHNVESLALHVVGLNLSSERVSLSWKTGNLRRWP